MVAQNQTGSCHCGAVKITVRLPEIISPHRCNCSICAMKSTVVIDFKADQMEIVAGDDALRSYVFGSGIAKHWFCAHCGIQIFQNLRSDPAMMSVNAACLDMFDIWALPTIPVHDGRDNHPTDTGKSRRYAMMQTQQSLDGTNETGGPERPPVS